MSVKLKLLFLCTGNSCRSQMAEGWARQLISDRFEVYSAGIKKHGLNPLAVRVMAEAGVDIGHHASKTIDQLPTQNLEYVITLCDHANESCPLFPGKTKRFHVGFDDPPALAAKVENEEQKLDIYRRVRDEIRELVESLPVILEQNRGDDTDKGIRDDEARDTKS